MTSSDTPETIAKKIFVIIESFFPGATINIFLFKSQLTSSQHHYFNSHKWTISAQERNYVLSPSQSHQGISCSEQLFAFYMPNRQKSTFIDAKKDAKLSEQLNYTCEDCLYLVFKNSEGEDAGIITLSNWAKKSPLFPQKKLNKSLIKKTCQELSGYLHLFESYFIHQQLKSLSLDKASLTKRLEEDEEALKRRILELTMLYDTSSSLSSSLDYQQIIQDIMISINRVMPYSVCSILLLNFKEDGELFSRLNHSVSDAFLKASVSNTIKALSPHVTQKIDPALLEHHTTNAYSKSDAAPMDTDTIKSFANVPLIFKETVIGILNICSSNENHFAQNELTFLHTMANQLSSQLGRLTTIKHLEKSKINSLIESMGEGVIMIDNQQQLEICNPAASRILKLDSENITTQLLLDTFQEQGISTHYEQVLSSHHAVKNVEIISGDISYTANISPVKNAENSLLGTVLVFRDISELQKSNRIKSQRLDIISKASVLIKSITDTEDLLSVLMEFILTTAQGEMGSIQLKRGKKLETLVHSNFPDKIRRDYRFISGETITEHVSLKKDMLYIKNYSENKDLNQKTKILIQSYLCIPILVKNDVLGVINIAHKDTENITVLTDDDLTTLQTLTVLSGTAIQNSILFKETLEKQKIDQELKVANEIQQKLLPTKLPQIDGFQFGALSVPARTIGGDFYDFFELPDGSVGIIVADIVGKGVPAGLFMAMLKSNLHSCLPKHTSPKAALDEVNEILYRDPVINKFVPLIYCVINPKTKVLTYCNAGHEPAQLYTGKDFIALEPDGLPLGADDVSDFEEQTHTLDDGHILAVFTDGIIEARNAKGEEFGSEGFKDYIKTHSQLTALQLGEKLFSDVKLYCEDTPQHDDFTIVFMKLDASFNNAEELPIKENRVRVTSEKKHIKQIRKQTETLSREMGFDDTDVFNIKLAINEAHANVIEHAYQGRENGDIIFLFRIFTNRLEVVIKDYGPGMNQKTTKGQEHHLEDLEGSGLGVYLIKDLMDDVRYKSTSKVGTELTLIKYLPFANKETANGNH